MKFVIVFALCVAAAVAGPVSLVDPKTAEIKAQSFNNIGVDGYNFGYETSDGKSASEEAVLKNVGTENEAIEVRGQFSYIGDDGVQYAVTYVANENGFQPSAPHLPK